jgi:sortase A
VVVILAGGGLAAASVIGGGHTSDADDAPLLVTARPSTTSTPTTAASTTTTAPLLPTPGPIPEDPYAAEPLVPDGRLQIPAIGVDTTFYEGITLTTINHGPGHWPGTAMPGQLGNVVVAGHRVTHTHPFRNLDKLKPGDQAIFTTSQGTFTYVFLASNIVTPDRVDIASQTMDYTATMFACHPPGSAKFRIVATWHLLNPPPIP